LKIIFIKNILMGWGCSSVVEHLNSMHRLWVQATALQTKHKHNLKHFKIMKIKSFNLKLQNTTLDVSLLKFGKLQTPHSKRRTVTSYQYIISPKM
jgi:hypothetical protein